jgi:hypothetical protein
MDASTHQFHDEIVLLRDRLQELSATVTQTLATFEAAQVPAEILVTDAEDLQTVLSLVMTGSTVRLEDGGTFVGNFVIEKPLTLVTRTAIVRTPNTRPALTIEGDDVTVDGLRIEPQPNVLTNDVIVVTGAHARIVNCVIWGNGFTKRGIAANGFGLLIESCLIRQIGRVGQESQAVACWDGDSIIIRNSFLEAGSTPFLAGGAAPAVPNHVPADILLENCTLTHPLDWRGQGYVNKTGFELKSGRRVVVRNCTIENVWVEGQTGYAITLTPSQYGNSPENVVEDVLFDGCTIRNVGGGANILGFTQHADRPTLRAHGLRFLNNTFVISRAEYGGHGSLMQLGIEPADILWDGNTVTADGDAFLRTTDRRAITGFVFTNNRVNRCGTYGVWTPAGSRGLGFSTAFPLGLIEGNTFMNAHVTFKANFPRNSWESTT